MNLIYNENPETFCLAIERLNPSENISNQSLNSSMAAEKSISNYLEAYFTLICHQLRQSEQAHLFVSANQLNSSAVKFAYPVLLVLGVLGNTASFMAMLAMHKRKKKSNRLSVNLAALAVADVGVLAFGCFREYSDDVLGWRVRSMNALLCKLLYFECYLFSCFSAYLHAYIAIERWRAVSRPIKSRVSSCQNKKSMAVLFVASVVASLPYAFLARVKQSLRVSKESLVGVQVASACEIAQESSLADLIVAVNDCLICCMIPFLLTFSFCALTLLQLVKNKRTKSDPTGKHLSSMKLSESEQMVASDSASNLKLTMMLMSLPVCYLITNFPIFVILIAQFYDQNANDYKLELVVAKVLMYTNNSVNILFYVFLGKNFRKVLADLMFRRFCFKFTRE
jgi:hypothetical protein